MKKQKTLSTAWILLGVITGALLGFFVPVAHPVMVWVQWGALGLMVFLVVSSLPLLSVGKAMSRPRVLVPLFILNLAVVPLIAFVLSRVVWQFPELQVGLLLVLLAPGVALSLATAAQVGGDVESVLATTPLLLGGQLIVVPLYAIALSGGVLSFSDLPPTFIVIGLVIVLPSLLALVLQLVARANMTVARVRNGLGWFTIPVIALAVMMVVWNRLPDQLEQLEELYRLVPLFFAFLVMLAPIGLLAGILASVTAAQKRALMIVGAGRGGIIMLPIAMGLDEGTWGLVPLVVVVQLSIEVLGMMVYRSIVPEIVPSYLR
jgi:ACR3 family arsenite transporter